VNPWLEFFGRLHPLVLHLPIGIFFLALLIELRGRFRSDAPWAAAARYALGWSAFTAVLACATGWRLGTDYSNALLEQHRWTGIATALAMIAVWLSRVHEVRPGFRALASLLTCGLLGVAAHHGGSMTHGEDFLTGALPPPFGRPAAEVVADAPVPDTVFAALVQPTLEASCVKCHGPEKTKGNVRMDTHAHLLAAKKGEVVVPGQPKTSKLLIVSQLPRDDDDAMPPAGKGDPLTPDQLAVVTWWVEQGAKVDLPLSALPAELKPKADAVRKLVAKSAAAKPVAPAAPALPPADPKVLAALSNDGLLVQPLSQQDALLSVECVNLGTNFNGAWLQRLVPVAPQVAWLDASRTALSTGSLVHLTRFANLTKLRLNGTTVGDGDLQPLVMLRKLEYLNLTSTPVSDAAVDRLAGLKSLKRLYVWDSAITTQGVARLRAARPDLEVDAGAAPAPATATTPSAAPAAAAAPAPATAAAGQPVNTMCPVKDGSKADPAITFTYEGKVIAFCCNKCCAAFQKDPKAYLAKLPK
jgi:uncharacterized membrane protein/YHS domain-containing protein